MGGGERRAKSVHRDVWITVDVIAVEVEAVIDLDVTAQVVEGIAIEAMTTPMMTVDLQDTV